MQFIGRVFLSAIIVLGAHTVAAQETINYGTISGRVVDPQGAVISGALATARHTGTNLKREAVTDDEGRFRFPYLRVGTYEIIVRLSGFADATRNVTVTIGSAFELPIALSVAGLDTSVTVTGETTVLEAARSQIAGTVAQIEVQDLPMNGRNFLDLALLVPGVSPTNTASTQLFAETSAVPGQGISVGSQRNLSNNFIVDGLSANDDAAGLSGMTYGVDAVDQFQVVTSGGQAELGRALGGYISVVTKSGSNDPHGQMYGYLRDTKLNAANALSGTKLPMTQKQYGASLGGPIVRNRTFYFSNVEQRRLDQTGLATISEANVQAINARLAAVAYPGSLISTGLYPNPVDTTNFLAKVDHQISNRDQLGVRFSLYDVGSSNCSRRRRFECSDGLVGARQRRSVVCVQQHRDAIVENGQRDACAVRVRQSQGAAQRSDRAGRQHRWRGVVRHAVGKPAGASEQDVSGRQQPLASGGRPRAAGRRRFPLQRRHDHFSAIGARGVHVFVSRELSDRDLQYVGFHPDLRRDDCVTDQRERRRVRAG